MISKMPWVNETTSCPHKNFIGHLLKQSPTGSRLGPGDLCFSKDSIDNEVF